MDRMGDCILIVNKLIYLMIPLTFTFLFPSPSIFRFELYKNVIFLWCFIAEKEKNKWVKCTVLTETKHCGNFSGWIDTAVFLNI